jgi:hypothetical protein
MLAVGDVSVRVDPAIDKALGEAKVDGVEEVFPLSEAHEEVVGLDVSMEVAAGMEVFDACE